MEIALSVVSAAGIVFTPKIYACNMIYFHDSGFGRRVSWRDDQVIPIGRRMTFKEALHIVSTDMGLRILLPEWAMGLTQRFRKVRIAFEDFEVGTIFRLREFNISHIF